VLNVSKLGSALSGRENLLNTATFLGTWLSMEERNADASRSVDSLNEEDRCA
jgi:hypothetical protein